ncbi:MAG: UvrABC system protein C [Firmicutes bacterium ADurb.Bin419]|nr:MAG: UvrABC system protein C [Firmicutes bacterium ADurb.Bin419]
MVKDSNHRTRGIVSKDKEYELSKDLNLLRFITSIQDEAHRFAIEYNRKLVKKRYKGSVLDEIEGIGPKRKKALIKHFGSVKNIKQAQIDDLTAVEGITPVLARKIIEYLR